MPDVSLFVAAALAFCVGFALQRGSICAVLAVRDVVDEGRWRRFLAFLECAAWALAGLLVADASGFKPIATWPWQGSLLAAVAGGALFGAGAMVNGACAFGSLSRFASGESSFLAVIIGFVAAGDIANRIGARGEIVAHTPLAMPTWALTVLAAALAMFAFWRVAGAWRAAPNLRRAATIIATPRWPPALSMFVIGFANVALVLLIADWSYTTLLVDVVSGHGDNNLLRGVLALLVLGGGFAGALTARRFKLRGATVRDVAVRLSGGALMGFGAAMIPGGNDALVLLGMPLLHPAAFTAYAAMVATLVLGFWARRLGARYHPAHTTSKQR